MSIKTRLDETMLLCNGGKDGAEYDPLHGDLSDPDQAARVHRLDNIGAVYLQGTADAITKESGEYADDLLIVCMNKGWALFFRDPPDLPEKDKGWGTIWVGGRIHEEWDSLVGEAYSL